MDDLLLGVVDLVAPFVGTFIVRISKGRTVREFIVGVLLIPSGVSFVWFAVFGGAAIDLQLTGQADLAGVVDRPEIALFTMLEQFPLSGVTSFLVIVLVALFFVSGADAASVVMGMLSSGGSLSPARWVVVTWGVFTGASAAVLLLAGGLDALQQAAIIAAAPFTLVMIGLCVSLFKALDEDFGRVRRGPVRDRARDPGKNAHDRGSRPLGGTEADHGATRKRVAQPPHSPFRGVYEAFAELNRMREHWTQQAQAEPVAEQRSHASAWVPVMDILARGDDLVVRIELPGVRRDDISLSLADGKLWIAGERVDDPEEGDLDHYVRERHTGPFRRSISVPGETTPEQVSASVADGLLEIRVEGMTEPREHETIEIAGADSGAAPVRVSSSSS